MNTGMGIITEVEMRERERAARERYLVDGCDLTPWITEQRENARHEASLSHWVEAWRTHLVRFMSGRR